MPLLSDRYDLLRSLGEGSAGTVHLARDVETGRTVAVKVLKSGPAIIPQAAERFQQEARTLAKIESPYVVRVLDFGQADDVLFLVMEYADGHDLSQLVKADGPMAPERATQVLRDVARGLEAIHAGGVVHRDLKPGNVILDAQGTPRIADFGLAKAVGGSDVRTRDGMILGTPGFVAPEILQGHPPSPAADMYALGVLAHYLLLGRIPFEGKDHAAVFQAQLRGVPSGRGDALPPGLRRLVSQLTTRQVGARLDAARVAKALENVRLDEAPPAPSTELAPTGMTQPQREHLSTATFRRRGLRGLATASGLLAVLLWLVVGPRPPAPPPPPTPPPGAGVSTDAVVEELLGRLDSFDLGEWIQRIATENFTECPMQRDRDQPVLWVPQLRSRLLEDLRGAPWMDALAGLQDRAHPGWWRDLPREATDRREALVIRRWLHRRLLEVARLNALDVAMGGPGNLVPLVGPLLEPVHRSSVRLDVDGMGHQVPGVETLDTRCYYLTDHPDSAFLNSTLIMPSLTAGSEATRFCEGNRDVSRPFASRTLALDGPRARAEGLAGVVVGIIELAPFATLEARFLDDAGATLASAFVHTKSLLPHHRASIAVIGWKAAQVELLVDASLLDGQAREVEVRYRDLLGDLAMCEDYHHYCGSQGYGWVEGVRGLGFAGTDGAPGVTR